MRYLESWQSLWHDLGVTNPDLTLLQALLQRYSEPHRRYHTLQHLDACFANFAAVREQATHPAEVELALWFHDAVYEIQLAGNEQLSADWARNALLAAGGVPAAAQRVHALVLSTCHHAMPETPDEAILLDVDLAILGAPPAQFDEYEAQVRAEYAMVAQPQFRSGRRRILQQFLARERLFHTAHFYASHEPPARINLRRSIAQLAD